MLPPSNASDYEQVIHVYVEFEYFRVRQQLRCLQSGFCFRSWTTKERFPRARRRGQCLPAKLINANLCKPIGSCN